MSIRASFAPLLVALWALPAAAQEQGVEPDPGPALFAALCAPCHGADGSGASDAQGAALGPSLTSVERDAEDVSRALWGSPPLAAHEFEMLNDVQRQGLASYVADVTRQPTSPPVEEPGDAPIESAPAKIVEPEPASSEQSREAEMFGSTDDAEREAELFGGDPPATAEAPSSNDGDDRVEALARPTLSDAEIETVLAEKDDPLTLGAFLFMQAQYAALEEGDASEFRLSTPALLDVYVDGRPNERVRAYVRGRLTTDPTIASDAVDFAGEPIPRTEARLDQLWLKFDLWRAVYATVGKQRIKWGTGRFWNPTDFLNNERLDPLEVAVFDDRLGVTLARLHLPIEALGWNFYAIATMDDAASPRDVGGAFRAEFLLGLTETALSAAFRRNNPWRIGADLSTGVWLFDLRLEAALLHDDERPFYRGELEFPSTFPEEYSRADDWIPQVVAGVEVQVQYNDEDTFFVGMEYFFNDAGYPDADLYPWLFVNQAFTPFYVGRHYAAAYGLLAGPGNWDDTSFTLSGLGNLSDRSFVARLDVSQTVLTYLRWNVFVNGHFGELGEFRYGLELEPNPLLPDGLSIVAPLLEVGAGLRLSL